MSAPRSRMCSYCAQSYRLGRRREFLEFCGYHCFWYDAGLRLDLAHEHRMLDMQEPIKATIVMAGGNGQTITVQAQVRDWPSPMLSMNGSARHE